MNHRVWIDPRLSLVRVAGIRSYLLGRGWRLRPYPAPELLVFEGPADDDGQPIVQVLPSSEQMRDFPPRVEELIAALSILEDRPASDILSDILNERTTEAPQAAEENGKQHGRRPSIGRAEIVQVGSCGKRDEVKRSVIRAVSLPS